MGVATYRLPSDVPEEYKAMRPIMEHAQRLLESDDEEEVMFNSSASEA